MHLTIAARVGLLGACLGAALVGAGSYDEAQPRVAASAQSEPQAAAENAFITTVIPVDPARPLKDQLVDAGANPAEAQVVTTTLLAELDQLLTPQDRIELGLGRKLDSGRAIITASLYRNDALIRAKRDGDGWARSETRQAIGRYGGTLDQNAYWSLRKAGLDAAMARDVASLIPASKQGDFKLATVTRQRPMSGAADVRIAALRISGPAGSKARWVLDEDSQQLVDIDHAAIERDLPVRGTISSAFGPRAHPILGWVRNHDGLDIAARYGEPVLLLLDGRVVRAGWSGGYGRMVEIDHGNGLRSRYGHLSRIDVRPGDRLFAGVAIGAVGSSGLSTSSHLHFEVRDRGRPVNPLRTPLHRDGLTGTDKARLERLLAMYLGTA